MSFANTAGLASGPESNTKIVDALQSTLGESATFTTVEALNIDEFTIIVQFNAAVNTALEGSIESKVKRKF